jgi:DNA repair ATPase RecN|tara:strand:+ start:77 stop:400 length:324 start_codon:yes stop_codon:yes gene_type:complete
MDGREQVLNVLEALGRVIGGLESDEDPSLNNASGELKEAAARLDEIKNKLFMRSKKSLNFTKPLWEVTVSLENSLNSTEETTQRAEDFKAKLEALEKAVKSHSVLIT